MSLLLTSLERLTSSWPVHVLESDSEVKHVVTSACFQNDVDHITLSDGVVLWIKPHLNSCRWIIALIGITYDHWIWQLYRIITHVPHIPPLTPPTPHNITHTCIHTYIHAHHIFEETWNHNYVCIFRKLCIFIIYIQLHGQTVHTYPDRYPQ